MAISTIRSRFDQLLRDPRLTEEALSAGKVTVYDNFTIREWACPNDLLGKVIYILKVVVQELIDHLPFTPNRSHHQVAVAIVRFLKNPQELFNKKDFDQAITYLEILKKIAEKDNNRRWTWFRGKSSTLMQQRIEKIRTIQQQRISVAAQLEPSPEQPVQQQNVAQNVQPEEPLVIVEQEPPPAPISRREAILRDINANVAAKLGEIMEDYPKWRKEHPSKVLISKTSRSPLSTPELNSIQRITGARQNDSSDDEEEKVDPSAEKLSTYTNKYFPYLTNLGQLLGIAIDSLVHSNMTIDHSVGNLIDVELLALKKECHRIEEVVAKRCHDLVDPASPWVIFDPLSQGFQKLTFTAISVFDISELEKVFQTNQKTLLETLELHRTRAQTNTLFDPQREVMNKKLKEIKNDSHINNKNKAKRERVGALGEKFIKEIRNTYGHLYHINGLLSSYRSSKTTSVDASIENLFKIIERKIAEESDYRITWLQGMIYFESLREIAKTGQLFDVNFDGLIDALEDGIDVEKAREQLNRELTNVGDALQLIAPQLPAHREGKSIEAYREDQLPTLYNFRKKVIGKCDEKIEFLQKSMQDTPRRLSRQYTAYQLEPEAIKHRIDDEEKKWGPTE